MLYLIGFLVGALVGALIAKARNAEKHNYHKLLYLLNIAQTQLLVINKMAAKALFSGHQKGHGPYRENFVANFVKTLQEIEEHSTGNLEAKVKDITCFDTQKQVMSFLSKQEKQTDYMVIKNERQGKIHCWHVIYFPGLNAADCTKCIHREGWKENECGVGNPAWPDPLCPAFESDKHACSDPNCPSNRTMN